MRCRSRIAKLGLILFALLTVAPACAGSGDERTLLMDDFGNPRSGWGEDERGAFTRRYADGEYVIELFRQGWFVWASPKRRFGDVSIEVDAYLASGSSDNHLGVICGQQDTDDFYYLAISSDGYYGIFQRVGGGSLEPLTEQEGMVFSSAIKTGDGVNHLRAICQEDELSLFVNGTLLETVIVPSLAGGRVGIGAGSGPQGDVEIHFDDYVVAKP